VTITNTTGASLSISKIAASGNFAVAGSGTTPCGGSLAGGAKCTMAVSFSPSINGTIKGAIAITDSTAVSSQVYNVSGTGVLPLSFTPASITFAARTVGTTSSLMTVTLTNNQSTTLTITGIVASGNYTTAPSGTNACGLSVAAHTKCMFSVAFTPSARGTIKGVVTIAHNASFGPQEVKLAGAGSLGGGTLTIVPKAGSVSATVAAYLTKLIADMQPVQRAECGSASGSHTIEIVYDPNQGWHYDENNLIIVMHDLPNPDSNGVDQNFDLSVIHESTHALQTDILRIINGWNLRGTNADGEGFAQSCAYRVSRALALTGKRKDLPDGGTGSMLQFDLFRSFDAVPIAAGFWSSFPPFEQAERNLGEAAYLLAGSQIGTSGSNAVVEHENALFATETAATAPLTGQERIQPWDSMSANLDRKTLGAWLPSEMIQDPDFSLMQNQQPKLIAWPIVPQFPAEMVAQVSIVTKADPFNQPTVTTITSGPLTITVKDVQGAVVLGPIPTDFAKTFNTANPFPLGLQNKAVGIYTVNVDANIKGTALHTNFAVGNITLSCIGAVNALNVSFSYLVAVDSAGNAVNGTLTVTRGTTIWPTECGTPISGFLVVKPDATGTFDVTGPSGTPHTYTAIDPWARFIPVE